MALVEFGESEAVESIVVKRCVRMEIKLGSRY